MCPLVLHVMFFHLKDFLRRRKDSPCPVDSQTDKEDDKNMVCVPEQLIGRLPDELGGRGHDQDQSQRDQQASNTRDCP